MPLNHADPHGSAESYPILIAAGEAETQRPEVLTLNGAAELVVQNAEAYQTMLDRLEELETLVALNVASAEIDRAEGAPSEEALVRLRRRIEVSKETR